MTLIVFGSQIVSVNDQPISDGLRKRADQIRSAVIARLQRGRLLTSLYPVRFGGFSPTPRNTNGKSPAVVADEICKNRFELPTDIKSLFLTKLAELRKTFFDPIRIRLVDFEQPKGDFDSESSFQGKKLKKLITPKKFDASREKLEPEEMKEASSETTSSFSRQSDSDAFDSTKSDSATGHLPKFRGEVVSNDSEICTSYAETDDYAASESLDQS
jgi:hypothetical protein